MSEVHVENEPPPPPRGLRMKGGCHIMLVKESTGEVVQEIKTPDYCINERVPREERKY